jgi:RecB family endonuclease NucS
VVIEVKRRQITVSTAYQAMRYVQALTDTKEYRRKAAVLLVAPSIARGATEWIERQKMIDFYRLSYEALRDL